MFQIFTRTLNNTALYILSDVSVAKPPKQHIEELLGNIKEHHLKISLNKDIVSLNPQHKMLRPTLRPYQRDAVVWMLYREGFHLNPSCGPVDNGK